jgi:hypothetical protein
MPSGYSPDGPREFKQLIPKESALRSEFLGYWTLGIILEHPP